MSQKIYLLILKWGVYLSLTTVFLVYKNLLFPFITSKQITFNIIIEILLVFWVALIVKYPEYRPKKSYITFGLLGFFAAIFFSSIIGVDWNLSFWGDVERMLGVFHLLHFLGFYFIIITAFKRWSDWKLLFIISIILATVESFMVLGDDKSHYGTIGNTAYVSAYLIFNIYFALILFFKEKTNMLKWLYLIPLPLMLIAFKKADTTGATVGLGFSVIIMFLLYAIFSKHKKTRLISILIFIIMSVSAVGLIANKNSDFVKKYSFFRPIRSIDIHKDTFQTRLISWRAAWYDFKTHPLFGTGFGNYAIIFDKYFTPNFYNYTRSETYFDRAHNNLIDIASTSGLLGLLTYLSIFVAAMYYLFWSYYKKKLPLNEFILITGLLIAYFVQNLAVFDALVTYIGIMITLAYIYWLHKEAHEGILADVGEKAIMFKDKILKDRTLENKEIYALVISALVLFVIMYQYNLMPLKMLERTIDGQRAFAQGRTEETIDIYKDALGHNTVLDRDSRTSLLRVIISNPNKLQQIPADKLQPTLEYLVGLAEANVAYNKGDSLNQMMLAQILNVAASFNKDNKSKFMFYSDRALKAIDASIAASPGRIPIYYQKAQIYITRGEQDNALDTLRYAASLSPDYYDSFCNLGKTLLYFGKNEEGFQNIDKCLDLGGASLLAPSGLVRSLIEQYEQNQDIPRTIILRKRLSALEPKNAKNWVSLSKLYADQGETDLAIAAATKAAKADKTISQFAEDFIKSLKGK